MTTHAPNPPSRATLRPETLDVHGIRTAIRSAVEAQASRFRGTVLDLGCGAQPYRTVVTSSSQVTKYLGMDLADNAYGCKPDLVWDGSTIPLPDSSVDALLATEVLEHCPEPDVVLSEATRVLKPGGMILLTVPFLWPLHDVPQDFWRFTPFALERLLRRQGLVRVKIDGLGGWDASLAQAIGLWVRRRPMRSGIRAVLSFLLWPVVATLEMTRQRPAFSEGSMITGIVAVAWKDSA